MAVAVEAKHRGKEGLTAVVDDLHTDERTHPEVNMVVDG